MHKPDKGLDLRHLPRVFTKFIDQGNLKLSPSCRFQERTDVNQRVAPYLDRR
jgi:hypothetical protein